MKLILSIALLIFFIFPSYAYDEKVKLNRTDNKIISGETKIKVSRNNMLNFRKIKQINKKFASIEVEVKRTTTSAALISLYERDKMPSLRACVQD